jgi:hypothetical protein
MICFQFHCSINAIFRQSRNKKHTAFSRVKSHPLFPNPTSASGGVVKNIWLAFRQAKENIARESDNSDFIPFLVRFYDLARTYFTTK